ncbi:Site-specific recombinase XerD [Variovorax sp. HW608]|nr:Site-specific recombinase XerD [Variovorax sp. HW608]
MIYRAMARTYAFTTETAGDPLPWLQDPVEAHRRWRSTLSWKRDASAADADAPLYAEHSNKLYQSFWGKFCRWLAGRSLKLDAVRQTHIEAFLKSLEGRHGAPASVRTMRTYLAEIDRVFTHLHAIGILDANPAATVLARKRRAPESQFETDPPLPPGPGFLKAYEKTALRMFREERAELPRAWTPARNLALRLIVAECGLKLSEICKLIPRNVTIQPDGTVLIRSPGHRQVVTRPLVGRPLLARAMQGWLDARRGLRIVQTRRARAEDGRRSNRLFLGQADRVMSAELVGGGLGDACSPVAPDLAERVITSCVKRTLESLGHEAAFHGPQLVRNAYAARLIRDGMSDAEVSGLLGMRTTFTARAIRTKLGLPDGAGP